MIYYIVIYIQMFYLWENKTMKWIYGSNDEFILMIINEWMKLILIPTSIFWFGSIHLILNISMIRCRWQNGINMRFSCNGMVSFLTW